MKYIKAVVGVIIAVWLVTMIMGSRVRPGSWLFPLRTGVNEPFWVWIHITAPGRAATLQDILDTRYTELERAWFSRDQKQISAAQAALQRTSEAVVSAIQNYTIAGDYKVADSLAAVSISMASVHGQVLEALVTHGAVAQTSADVVFAKDIAEVLQSMRADEIKKFTTAFSKEDLVKGIDGRLKETQALQEEVRNELRNADSLLQPEQKAALSAILTETQAAYESARNKLGGDQYVEGFVLADTTLGRLHEVRIAIRATQEFGVPVIPAVKATRSGK